MARYLNSTNQLNINISKESFQLVECGYAEIDQQWKNIVAYFPYYRIYLITEGIAKLQLKDSLLELEPNTLYFIPSFQIVSGECNDCLKHYYIHFLPKKESLTTLDFYKPTQAITANSHDVHLFKELLKAFPKNDMANTIRKAGIFQYLLAKFFDNTENYSNDLLRFKSVLKYINDHLNEQISTACLASVANLNEVYFSNLFSKTFGISPVKYINQKKMNTAATMLVETKMSVKEIAYSLGFENETYFFRIFKKTFGITPSQYKNKNL